MNPYLDALTGPSWLAVGHDNIVTYTFAGDYGQPWTAAEQTAFMAVFAAYSSVCNITFAEAPRGEAEIVENKVTAAEMTALMGVQWSGWHDEPGDGERRGLFDSTLDYWSSSLGVGGKAHWLILHEIGHGIGLEHPHSTWHGSGLFPGVTANASHDTGDNGLNTYLTTAMSYNLPAVASLAYGHLWGPMAFDIAALQAMYGAVEKATGDDIYMLPDANAAGTYWTCLWDTGGTDTIGYAGTKAAYIDLRAATLLNEVGGGGNFSQANGIKGGYSIANGVTIENAYGGAGADTINGNAAANVLSGSQGNDVIRGYAGADILYGNAGADTLHLGSDSDIDRAVVYNGDKICQFDSGEDRIDVTQINARSVKIVASGANWLVQVNTDADATIEHTITVIGVKPLLSDIDW